MPASILIVDDERGIRESLGALLRDEGYDIAALESGEECLAHLERQSVRSDLARCVAEEDGRAGDARADSGAGCRADGGDDFRARKYRDGGARDETGRFRFHRKTSFAGKSDAGGAERAGIFAAGSGKPAAARGTRGEAPDFGQQRADEGAAAADCVDRADEWARADLWRERDWQGIGRAGACTPAVCAVRCSSWK